MVRKNTISACLILYNEEQLIRGCLERIKGHVDEIVIIHDGKCTDCTLRICKEFGARIYVRPRIGMCDPHRPFAFGKCRSEWVLNIDADEYVTPALAKRLRTLVTGASCDQFSFRWPMLVGKKWLDYGHKPFLFRKSKVVVYGFPHRIPTTSGEACASDLAVEHRPKRHIYTPGYYEKQAAWSVVHAGWIWKDLSEIPTLHVQEKEWPRSFRMKRSLSFLFPLIGVVVFLKEYLGGRVLRGALGWRQSMIDASYNYHLYKQVWFQRPRA